MLNALNMIGMLSVGVSGLLGRQNTYFIEIGIIENINGE